MFLGSDASKAHLHPEVNNYFGIRTLSGMSQFKQGIFSPTICHHFTPLHTASVNPTVLDTARAKGLVCVIYLNRVCLIQEIYSTSTLSSCTPLIIATSHVLFQQTCAK